MTDKEIINTLKSLKFYYNDKGEDSYVGFDDNDNEAIDEAIKALEEQRNITNEEMYQQLIHLEAENERLHDALKSQRYKPIILQEHDAEPRRFRAILDMATQEIYVCRLTRQGADILGMAIEEVQDEE